MCPHTVLEAYSQEIRVKKKFHRLKFNDQAKCASGIHQER